MFEDKIKELIFNTSIILLIIGVIFYLLLPKDRYRAKNISIAYIAAGTVGLTIMYFRSNPESYEFSSQIVAAVIVAIATFIISKVIKFFK